MNFDEVIIEYQINQEEQEVIMITDINVLNELFEAYVNMSFQETSKPMDFPRFLIKFQKDDSSVADWSIDYHMITCGSELGLGNREVTNGVVS